MFEGQPKWELYDLEKDPGESNDLIDTETDVKEALLAEYERWFEDVTGTRADEAIPPAILVDRRHENPVVLTWQDWFGGQWSFKKPGKWKVDMKHSGRMDVRVELPKGRKMNGEGWLCHLNFGNRNEELPLPAGEDWVTFEALPFQPGEILIDAFFTREGVDPMAAYHVRLLHR